MPSHMRGLRVLIIDDSANSREILLSLATCLGYEASAVASAEEGLAALRQDPFDVVLLDWQMPEVDGFEAARRIRQERRLPRIPRIIMVTAFRDDEFAGRAQAEGLENYLCKPVTASSLFDTIMRVFGQESGSTPVALSDAPFPSPEALKGARVLLVEDNDFNQQVATELLGMMGIEVTVAGNGREALDLIHSQTFDAVLMDLQMPVMDGYEATRLLRVDPAQANLPILAMTAHAMVQERERCRNLGMNDYITKPIDPEMLAATLTRWVRPFSAAETAKPPESMPAETEMADDLPGISRATGLRCFSGKVAIYEQVLKKFPQLKAQAAVEIRGALAEGDLVVAGRMAHSMISAAGTIGALDLSQTARELEQAISASESADIEVLLIQFENQLAHIVEGLRLRAERSAQAAGANGSGAAGA